MTFRSIQISIRIKLKTQEYKHYVQKFFCTMLYLIKIYLKIQIMSLYKRILSKYFFSIRYMFCTNTVVRLTETFMWRRI